MDALIATSRRGRDDVRLGRPAGTPHDLRPLDVLSAPLMLAVVPLDAAPANLRRRRLQQPTSEVGPPRYWRKPSGQIRLALQVLPAQHGCPTAPQFAVPQRWVVALHPRPKLHALPAQGDYGVQRGTPAGTNPSALLFL